MKIIEMNKKTEFKTAHLKISLLQIRLHRTGRTHQDKTRLNNEINWRYNQLKLDSLIDSIPFDTG